MSQETDDDGMVYLLWKVPKDWDEDLPTPWSDKGVYPTGELMALFERRPLAESVKDELEEWSPSARFGETGHPPDNDMDDAPYKFFIDSREVRSE